MARSVEKRFQRVLRHIAENFDGDLSVEALSDVAAFSKYHFHRQFLALFGMTAFRYVQLLRMKRASYRLAFRRDQSITHISFESGYEAPEAFSRAFKQCIGQTPSQFRKYPHWPSWHTVYGPISMRTRMIMAQMSQEKIVKIVDCPAIAVAILEHRGDPALIGASVQKFIAWRRQVGLPPKKSATFNILYDDPEVTPPAEYRIALCAATEAPVLPNDQGVVAGHIPAGRCAVLRVTGIGDSLRAAGFFLYADWLPKSGQTLRDFPLYCQRITMFPDVPEHEVITDLLLPLK